MDEDQRDILIEAFSNVIEKLAFMFVIPWDKEEIPRMESRCVTASLDFTGYKAGQMSIIAPDGMCVDLAANVLGVDRDDEKARERGKDSFKELVNVTCGNFLHMFSGSDNVYKLHPPEAVDAGAGEWQRYLEDPESVSLNVDETPVMLRIHFNDEAKTG